MRKIEAIFWLTLFIIGLLFMQCGPKRPATAAHDAAKVDREILPDSRTRDTNLKERTIEEIAVLWPEDDDHLQLSGMDWYNNDLIILPECKKRLKKTDELELSFYYIPKNKIAGYLYKNQNAGPAEPIRPMKLKFFIKGFSRLYRLYNGGLEFEGFEAIAFHQEKNILFLTVEANIAEITMKGFLVRGRIDPASLRINVNLYENPPVEIPADVNIRNFTYETLLVTGKKVIAIYEANGKNVNPRPKAYAYDHDLKTRAAIFFPHIGYRLTDATAVNLRNRFWCTNFYYPGDKERLLLENSGKNKEPVERLAGFKYDESGITLISSGFISLELLCKNPDCGRNWEGIVRFRDKSLNKDGFLVVTDKHPRTILGFVAKYE